jgi:hypothetical protein
MKKIIFILSATALLSSCGLYTNYQRPEKEAKLMTAPDTLVGKIAVNLQDSVPAWRSYFTDPNLQSLIEKGTGTKYQPKDCTSQSDRGGSSNYAVQNSHFCPIWL